MAIAAVLAPAVDSDRSTALGSPADLLPAVPLRLLASVPRPDEVPADSAVQAVATEDGVALALGGNRAVPGQLVYVDGHGDVAESRPLPIGLSTVTPGPDSVIYEITLTSAPSEVIALGLAAVPVLGERRGEVVALQPLGPDAVAAYVELPAVPFGNTSEGVVDLTRQPGNVLLRHVDRLGAPMVATDVPVGILGLVVDDSIEDTATGQTWTVELPRDPDYRPPQGRTGEQRPDCGQR